MEALGVTRKIPKQAGTVLKAYKATGTLQDGSTVSEGDIIPLSEYQTTWESVGEIKLKKWRKATSAEAIIEKGYDQAVIAMIDSNLQRERILPSEKAYAYKMRLEAMKHQGKKSDMNTLDKVGEAAGESGKTVQRYIWLARLSDELLDMVDKKKIGLVQGVDISFLTEQAQEWVQVILEETGAAISTTQSSKLKEYGKNGELTLPMVRLILTEEKPKERKVTIKADKISRYFTEDYSSEDIENIIYQLLEEWNTGKASNKQ